MKLILLALIAAATVAIKQPIITYDTIKIPLLDSALVIKKTVIYLDTVKIIPGVKKNAISK
jgi:hypothetical protein